MSTPGGAAGHPDVLEEEIPGHPDDIGDEPMRKDTGGDSRGGRRRDQPIGNGGTPGGRKGGKTDQKPTIRR
jgi:hypothetical protein